MWVFQLRGLSHPWRGLPAGPSAGPSFRGPELRSCKHPLHPAKFERLYQRGDTVYVRIEGQPWHKLGIEGDNDLDKKINRLRKAERKGWYVQLVFPNGYNDDTCRTSNPDYTVKQVKMRKSFDGEEMEPEEDS